VNCFLRFWICLPLLAGGAAFAGEPSPAPFPSNLRPLVRVALYTNSQICTLYSISAVRIAADSGSAAVWKGSISAVAMPEGIRLSSGTGEEISARGRVRIASENRYNIIDVNGVSYRGSLVLVPGNRPGSFLVINEVDVEGYLMGVLPFEIGKQGRTKLEALKAQAVAARTYTFRRLQVIGDTRPFDVFCDVTDQVYKGRSGEYLLAERAVRETRGVVATFADSLAECYYFSTCGGRTATMKEVWQDKPDIAYLHGVDDQDSLGFMCARSRYFNWKNEWSYAQLNPIIRKFLPLVDSSARNCGDLKDMEISKRTSDGRVAELTIKTTKGTYRVFGDRVRWVLRRSDVGNPILFSSWFDLDLGLHLGKPKTITVKGHGWGHGVGMCQVGALEMSERGYPYEDILTHYYPGTRLVRWSYGAETDSSGVNQ